MFRTTTAPTALKVLLRRPDKPLPYRPWLRLVDVIGGRRDGRRGLAGDITGYTMEADQTTWLRHNGHSRDERVHSETVRHDALALQLTREADELTGKIKAAKKALKAAKTALDALPKVPTDPTQRGATENGTPVEVVRARRIREHDAAVLAPALARLAAAEATLAGLRERRRTVRATLAALAQVHRERTGRLTEFHQRRAHAYERAYLRRIAGGPPDTTA